MTYEEFVASNPKGHVIGSGWGSDHLWHKEWSSPSRTSYYKCARCYWPFGHSYHEMPSIFEAMREDGVPEKCARAQMWPIRPEYATKEEQATWAEVRAMVAEETQP